MSHASDRGRRLSFATALWRAAAATSPTWFPLLIGIAALLLARTGPGEQRRERVFDLLLSGLSSVPANKDIVIVDIDRRSLVSKGTWPWSRDKIASLIDMVADAKPRSIGIDILIEGPDEQSLAALARRLAEATGRDDIAQLAKTLPDGDQRLAAAIKKAPTSLGVAVSPDPADGASPKAQILRGTLSENNLLHAKGVVGPLRALASAASGLGVVLLPSDSDAKVRRVPLVVDAGGQLWPSLAVEVVRNYRNASSVVVSAGMGKLEVAGQAVPVNSDGTMRLLPLRHDPWATRVVSALEIFENPEEARQRLAGRIVLVGSSAPELGLLRAAANGSLVPSIVLHAAAVEQILVGVAPTRSGRIVAFEMIAALGACVLAIWVGQAASTLMGTLTVMLPAVLWMVSSLALIWRQQLLIDPFSVPMLAIGCFTLAGFLTTAAGKRREAAMRRRFEQHLTPEVVRKLVAQPGRAKLEGETREITALFTDVEGFTAMTERIDPRTLVRLLDRYFDGVTEIVVKHGGMVEKIVGDGIHAIFNAPFDLAQHPRQAVNCAIAVRDFGESFRKDAQAAAAGFGRTRVGIETGVVVVGDVGGGRKLDYTAHGEAMNMAARLEAANKTLGSSICIGPTTAARFPSNALRPLGRIEVRGRGAPAEVFDPWPDAVGEEERKTYLTAFALAERDPMAAADTLERMAYGRPDDLVPANLAARLRFVGIMAQLADFEQRRRNRVGESEADQ